MATKKSGTVEKKSAAPERKGTAKDVDLSKYLREIEMRAFEIFSERRKAGVEGDAMSDWLRAEEEIKIKFKLK